MYFTYIIVLLLHNNFYHLRNNHTFDFVFLMIFISDIIFSSDVKFPFFIYFF